MAVFAYRVARPDGSTLEGQIVRVSDVVAYVNHDIDDALRAGIIKDEDIPASLVKVLGKWHATRIDRMVMPKRPRVRKALHRNRSPDDNA